MRTPNSTYRLQFHAGFTLADAERLAGYLDELGITDLYASPILKARPGSTHGYDTTDPSQINPEVGTLDDLKMLGATLQSKRMGLLLDIVPNHMAASPDNPWWRDLLRHGENSPYATFFDIDWRQKLLLPFLAKPYGEALEGGELQVDANNGESELRYHGVSLPISIPQDADLSNPAGLDRVLSQQPYRLAYWRKTADAINYRRFFDIGDLIGMRVERDDVFRATHELVLKLVNAGLVTGLRIDHIDGLRDPQCYLERLPRMYVVVEKIIAGPESLPSDWRVSGSTGYDFVNALNELFIDRVGYEALKTAYAEFCGSTPTMQEVVRTCKQRVMPMLFAAEVRSLATSLALLAADDWYARDLTLGELEQALIQLTACLPVYRTYIRPGDNISQHDRALIEDAASLANELSPSPAYSFLRRVLLVEPPRRLIDRRGDWLDFVLRWQQFTGTVMAKGFEDTAFYVFNPLASLNEVGADPNGPESGLGVETFHRRMHERCSLWPQTMNAASTHDTKRSEDVRARISVLSEMPERWAEHVTRWSRWNRADAVPDKNEEIFIYQTMLGVWPIEADRLKEYVRKALREAKTHSSWTEINAFYEDRVLNFVDRILDSTKSGRFLEDFSAFQKKIGFYGAVSSLAQVILRVTAPGVPDFYQGNELWNYSLTDPDNRRPVDFESRRRMLDKLKAGVDWTQLLENWQDGRIKMAAIRKALGFRRDHRDIFLHGDYLPLRVTGGRAGHVVAFARRYENEWALTIVPRLVANLTRAGRWPIGKVWQDTAVAVSEQAPVEWVNVLTDESCSSVALRDAFRTTPFAILHGCRGGL